MPLSEGDCLYAAEQMAEAVTYYLYRQVRHGTLSTDDIHQMILDRSVFDRSSSTPPPQLIVRTPPQTKTSAKTG